ncbi:MAG: sulfotransferase domain-containing protein [Pseudomonadota bacterium]
MTQRKLYLGPLTDNRRWDHVTVRADDVIVVTPPKCGTTWMQTIVALLISGDPDVDTKLSEKMPWVDLRLREIGDLSARLAAMKQQRCMKSHTPLDGLPVGEAGQYLAVFRHPLDAHFSYRNHLRNTPLSLFDMWYPDHDPDGVTFRRFLDGGPEGFDGDAMPLAHILRHYRAARAAAARRNVTLFHYADMLRDLPGTFQTVAGLIGVSHPPEVMAQLVTAASFDHMQRHATRYCPAGGTGFFRSDAAFFNRGGTGQWQGQLSASELAGYDAMIDEYLTVEERARLEHGDRP